MTERLNPPPTREIRDRIKAIRQEEAVLNRLLVAARERDRTETTRRKQQKEAAHAS